MDSFETFPRKIPKNIIHRKIIPNEIMKVMTDASATIKNGIKGINPPRNGDPPFTRATTFPANDWALS